MYPILRIAHEIYRVRKLPPLGFFEQHRSQIRIYPWDLDIFMELNNGRTLTLYDIPRIALAKRNGIWEIMQKEKITMTVAGIAVRYRRRITLWQKITMTAQCIGLDEQFVYIVQNCYLNGQAAGQSLVRMAFVKNGIVPPKSLIERLRPDLVIPPLPDWVNGYIDAANQRPWPPEETS